MALRRMAFRPCHGQGQTNVVSGYSAVVDTTERTITSPTLRLGPNLGPCHRGPDPATPGRRTARLVSEVILDRETFSAQRSVLEDMRADPAQANKGDNSMTPQGSPMPEFNRPPVHETVLGLEFQPLASFQIPHFGLYWETVKDDFPIFEVVPPLGASELQQASPADEFVLQLQVSGTPPVRCWFMENSKARLIQVQRDRFIHNWRNVSLDKEYPRYEKVVRPSFIREWQRFLDFLQSHGLESPKISQCEVSYINHFEKNREWEDISELHEVIRLWAQAVPDSFLPPPNTVRLNTTYDLPEDRGTLRVSVTPAIRHSDAKEILQFTLTAKGSPVSSELDDLLNWFDLGREWVVRGFTDLTTSKMHELWERTV